MNIFNRTNWRIIFPNFLICRTCQMKISMSSSKFFVPYKDFLARDGGYTRIGSDRKMTRLSGCHVPANEYNSASQAKWSRRAVNADRGTTPREGTNGLVDQHSLACSKHVYVLR